MDGEFQSGRPGAVPTFPFARPESHPERVWGRPFSRSRDAARRAERPASFGFWSPLPNGWILDGGLRAFRGELAFAGRSTAALKLLLVVALAAGRSADVDTSGGQTSAELTYDRLTLLTGLSRPLVAASKKFLCGQGILRVSASRQSGRERYWLEGRSTQAPGSIHHAVAIDPETNAGLSQLRGLPCRQASALHALKLYVFLSALRREGQQSVATSRAEIEALSGLRKSQFETAVEELRQRKLLAGHLSRVLVSADDKAFLLRVRPVS